MKNKHSVSEIIVATGDIIAYISVILFAVRIGIFLFDTIFKIPMPDFVKYILLSVYGFLWLVGFIVYRTEKSEQGEYR